MEFEVARDEITACGGERYEGGGRGFALAAIGGLASGEGIEAASTPSIDDAILLACVSLQ